MSLTVLDLFVLVVVLISAILAMVRGFVREVLSIASWIAAAAAAYFFYKPVVPLVRPYIDSGTVQIIVAAAAVFFIALIITSYVTMRISDFVIDSRVGALDRALGFLFGAARGMLLLVIALWFFKFLVPIPPDWVTNAQSKPLLEDLGEQLVAALPEDMEAWIQTHRRSDDNEPASSADTTLPPADDLGDSTAAPNEMNYDSGARQSLDTLIENRAAPAGN
jgi:membrane protein required for colicin V production